MLTCKYVPSIWRIKEALKAKVTSGISNKMADDCKLLQVIVLLLLSWHILTYQVECFAVWFNFMFFHVLYKAAVCVSVGENYINGMPSVDLSCITIIKWVKITQSTQKCLNQQTCFALILKKKEKKKKIGQCCSADSRVPPKVFHQRGVFWHLFDVLPVFIWGKHKITACHTLSRRTYYVGCFYFKQKRS